MQERGATQDDVGEAVMTAKQAQPSPDHANRWRLRGGCDLDGDPLDVVIAVDGNVVTVITLMGE